MTGMCRQKEPLTRGEFFNRSILILKMPLPLHHHHPLMLILIIPPLLGGGVPPGDDAFNANTPLCEKNITELLREILSHRFKKRTALSHE
jgi:hypothetical protein